MSGAALAVGICGVVLASLSLGWQAAMYVLSGGRVKVRLLIGATGKEGMATGSTQNLSANWQHSFASEGFSQPIVAVNVVNVGRQPVNVTRWGLKSGLGISLYPPHNKIGPSLPHRLEVGDAAMWAVDMDLVRGFFQTANEDLGKSQRVESSRAMDLARQIHEQQGRPEGTDIVGVAELADGRERFSETILPARCLPGSTVE